MAYVYPKQKNSKPSLPHLQRGVFIGLVLVAALVAFELFNFATTEYALSTMLGGINVLNVSWASVLAVAFCAIDFAGLARLFTPEQGRDEPKEVWFLLGAWFLGASMNAIMTWWAVTNALIGRQLGNEVITRDQLLTIVPVFVACLVWLTRILIIGTFGVAGERLFSLGQSKTQSTQRAIPARTTSAQRPPQRYGTTARPSQQRQQKQQRQQPYRSTQRVQAFDEEDEELTYEDIHDDAPSPASSQRQGVNYRPYGGGYTRPAPKPNARPNYSYGYNMRAYSLTQPYIARPNTPGAPDSPADGLNENTTFYR